MTNVEAFEALLAELGGVPAETVALGLTMARELDAPPRGGVNAALVAQYVGLLEGMKPGAEEEADPAADMLADLRDRKASGAA